MVGIRTMSTKTKRQWIWSFLVVTGLALYFIQGPRFEYYMAPILGVLLSLGLFFLDSWTRRPVGAGAAFLFALLLFQIADWGLSIGSVGAVLFMLGWFALLAEKAKKWI
jgi:hypothetical protein